MVSVNKKKKQVNAYGVPQILKDKEVHCKRFLFYTPSERKRLKDEVRNIKPEDMDMDVKVGDSVSLTEYNSNKTYTVRDIDKTADETWILLSDGVWYRKKYIGPPIQKE